MASLSTSMSSCSHTTQLTLTHGSKPETNQLEVYDSRKPIDLYALAFGTIALEPAGRGDSVAGMPLKLVLIVVSPVALTCGILFLSGVPWSINVRIAGVLLAFLFIAGLCQRAHSGARSQQLLLQEPDRDASTSMSALPREPTVGVGLGRAAIAGLPVYKYEKLRSGGAEGHECAVCLTEIRPKEVVKQLPACTHLFHDRCIDEWLWSHRTCPVCRSPVDASTVPAVEVAARAMQSV